MSTHSPLAWNAFPRELADRCVKCAQCLPTCPTWQLTGDEAESPRGRIAMMLALADGLVAADDSITRHLDQCLGCRHCEAVCPADVPYGHLADAAQAGLGALRRPAPWTARVLRRLVAWPALFNRLVVPLLRHLPHALVPRAAGRAPTSGITPAEGTPQGDAWLFLGCVARATDGATLEAARAALAAAGFAVRIPAMQGCCGALHRHHGDETTAQALADRNARAFSGDGPIVTCASGCAATLLEDERIAHRITDVSALLASRGARRAARAGTVLHTPCTLASVQKQADGPGALLSGMRAVPSRGRCCGAAGEYLLKHPDIAARLRERVLDEIGDAIVVCTSNPGCAMHLRAGLAARGAATEVRHPVLEWLRDEPA